MGACYSKSGAATSSSPPEKAPGLRKRLSWHSKKRDRESSSASRDVESLVGVQDSPQTSAPQTASGPSPDEVEPLLVGKPGEERESKSGASSLFQATVAPSDSGIESIGTVQEDGPDQQGTQLGEEVSELQLRRKDYHNKTTVASGNGEESDNSSGDETSGYLSRQLQRLSRGSCHKCGNFKLDDSALTALLADTYCLCGPRRAGRPSVNPHCQTHGLRHQRSIISSNGEALGTTTGNVSIDQSGADHHAHTSSSCELLETNKNSYDHMPLKSSLKKGRSSELLEEGRGRRVSLKSVEESSTSVSYQNNLDDVFEDEVSKDRESGQALWDRLGSLDKSLESLSVGSQQRRSLLSEILDITSSICHCDFYSNEVYCSAPDQQCAQEDISRSVQCVPTASTTKQQFSHDSISKSTPVLYPSLVKPCLGSAKNVSFANDNESKSLAASDTPTPNTRLTKAGQHKGKLERLSSVESVEGIVVSGSSSEDEDVSNVAETCEVHPAKCTQRSLSYSNAQQLVGRSRELTGSVCSARRMWVDGCDSVVIPTEVYCQLEADLSTMREQLQYLTSLMLEEQDEETTMYESDGLEESFA